MYAGPFGFLGFKPADIIVAIRSGIWLPMRFCNALPANFSVYAGVGVVPGSTVQGKWPETGYKLGVMSSQFAQSQLTLKSF